MDSFEEFLREVTPHNIQHQVSILKKQSVLWSEDTLVQIVNCIFEKVSAEPSDLIYLYVYTCKMMLEFEVKKIGSNTKVTTVTFEDVMQSRAGFHLTEILMKQEKGKQMKSKAGKKAGNGLGAVCSFLSQLFVQDVLSSDTLLFCIHALMAHNTEVTWQCLSKILKNSFVHLESLGTLHLFKCVFQKIYEKIQGKHFSVQTRFMLCDLNDLTEKNQETVEAQFHTFDKIRKQQPMSVNNQQALLFRMQSQTGQMHSMGFGIPSAAAPRTAPMQPASAPTIAPGSAGPRIMQHGTASGAHFGMQNPSFVPQHTMMKPAMFTPRTSNQNPQAAPPFSFPYFPATKSVQQNQGYYPPASQIPQASYSPQVMETQPPQSRNERKEKILSIMDPTSGEDLTESILRERDGVVIPPSSQVAGVGASSSPPQHKEPQRTSLQESRRIQIEFLTKVSQVASYPGSSELSKMAQPEDGAQPKGLVLAQIETARPVVTPAVPAQISKPPVTTEETLADASPPSVAASEATPSEQVVVSDPKQEEQQVEEDAVESTPPTTGRPQGLPNIPDIVLKKADVRPHLDNLFLPNYMKSPRMNQQAPSFPQGIKRRSKERKIISRPSASQDETLKRSENAWKSDSKKKKDSEDKDDDAELLRSIKSILNKLTLQNFQKLMNQTMQLPINSEERLTGVIDVVFEQAILEPKFTQAYANLCRVMQNIEVTKADGSKVQFRKLIIIKCQKQFERQRSDEKMEMEKKRIAALSEKEQEEALAELEYHQMIAKKQIIGNIRFIGELFKQSLLKEKRLQGCICLLLKAKDEESLECMSELLSIVGQSLDHQKGKALMDQYFNQVDKIIKKKKVSSRIRFMLQDLKDLRESNWKPRPNKAKPVMIDQIRKAAEMEKQMREQEQLTARLAPRHWSNRRLGCMEKYQDDGWNAVAGNRSTKQNVIDNPAKLNITRQIIDDNVQLGPGDRPGSLGDWGKGSSGGGGKSSSGSSEAKISKGNRFMMLREDELSRSMLPPSARDNKGRSSSGSKRSREREVYRSRERQSAIADMQRFTESLKSRFNELDRNQEKRVEPPAAVALSEEEYEKRSRYTIKEFVSIKDFKEAITCLEELKSPKLQHVFVRVAIEDVLEKSSGMRESVGRLFHRLLQSSTISVEQFNDGLNEILEFAEDMEIDIPLYWTYLGEIIGAMAAEGATNFAFLRDVVQKIPREGKSAECMAEILKAGVNLTSETHMAKIWKTSNFTWSLFLPSGTNIQEFVKNKKVSFTEQPVERVSQSTPKEETRIGNFQRDLILQFQNESLTNDEVCDFIEKSIPPDVRKTKEFIRALVSAVCFGAVKGEGTNSRGDHELLKKRSVLMQRYIDSDAKLELQALFAVQHLNYSLENPPGLLRLYFDVLYDEDVISEETFYSWRDSDDASEKTGKDIADKSVASFYTWLEESDPPN